MWIITASPIEAAQTHNALAHTVFRKAHVMMLWSWGQQKWSKDENHLGWNHAIGSWDGDAEQRVVELPCRGVWSMNVIGMRCGLKHLSQFLLHSWMLSQWKTFFKSLSSYMWQQIVIEDLYYVSGGVLSIEDTAGNKIEDPVSLSCCHSSRQMK
jgi:hypothetical protein